MNEIIVTNIQELEKECKKRTPKFTVTGELVNLIAEVKNSQISEEARLGIELGSNGQSAIFESLYLAFSRRNSENKDLEKTKDNLGKLYKITLSGADYAELSLFSLNY